MIVYITELNKDNFSTFIESGYTLVDVWAPWCGPCKMISPLVDEMSNKYQGQLSVGKMNADDNSDLVRELGIRNIPTLLFFKDGEPVMDENGNPVRLVGNVLREKLEGTIEQYL